MKRPAFQFYVKDWRNNLKLRRCTDAARGAWIDLLCLMHDSEEYGVLRWPLKEIASTAGIKLPLLRELATKVVLKGADKDAPAYVYTPRHAGKALPSITLLAASVNPMWYCSRFVRDEWIRLRRGESTRFSPTDQPPKAGPKTTPKDAPKPPIGAHLGDGSAVASASAVQSLTGGLVFEERGSDYPHGNPPEGKAKSKQSTGERWWSTPDGILAEGKRRGIPAKVGESMEQYRQRLFQTRDRAA